MPAVSADRQTAASIRLALRWATAVLFAALAFWLPRGAAAQEIQTLTGSAAHVYALAFSPDGKTIASAVIDGTVVLWDAASGQRLRVLNAHRVGATAVAFSRDGRYVASGGNDNVVRLWDAATGRLLKAFYGHKDEVLSVAFSPDGRIIASGALDHAFRLWDAVSGRELRTLGGHASDVRTISFSPNGRIVAANSGSDVKLWDVASGREVATLSGHDRRVLSVAFSPDGRTLASGSWDQTIKLWDISSRRDLSTLVGHTEAVNAIAFSPSGATLVSGSSDRSVKLWDVAAAQPLRSYDGRSDLVLSVGYSADGRTIASSEAGSIKLWDVSDIATSPKESAAPEPAPVVAEAPRESAPPPPAVAEVKSPPKAAPPVAPRPAPATGGRRVALIVANGAYRDAPLSNPAVDAGVVQTSLEKIGFSVSVKRDVDLDGFEQAITEFADAAKGAEIALFYFAGHGFSIAAGGRQQNLLMTTSANFAAKTSLSLQQGGEPLEHIEETIIGHAKATLIFVDACRNVPTLSSRGVGSRGFAPLDVEAFEGAYVVLSTRQGKTAGDGAPGGGSPFARAFAEVAPTPGLRIEDAYARIREKVRAESSGEQVPDVIRSDLPEGGVVLSGSR